MYRILINDSGSSSYNENTVYFGNISQWARDNCPSFQGMEVLDVSDVSLQWDEIAEFTFTEGQDAAAFKLKWNVK